MSFIINRRHFLQSLVAAVGTSNLLAGCEGISYDTLASKLAAPLSRKDLAVKVGKAYKKYIHTGEQLDLTKTVKSILAVIELSPEQLQAIEPSELKLILHQQIKSDFKTENVLQVVGWILSDLETRLCLITYLQDQQNKRV